MFKWVRAGNQPVDNTLPFITFRVSYKFGVRSTNQIYVPGP